MGRQMIEIPLAQTPNQSFNIVLGEQNCTIRIITRKPGDEQIPGGTYVDLAVGEDTIFGGVIARDRVGLKLYPYLPFSGQLVFADLEGAQDPQYTGFGERWRMFYLTEEEAQNV